MRPDYKKEWQRNFLRNSVITLSTIKSNLQRQWVVERKFKYKCKPFVQHQFFQFYLFVLYQFF